MPQPSNRRLVTEDRFLTTKSEATAAYTAVTNIAGLSPNYIINSAFDFWQRGTTFSSAGYTADRWILLLDGSGATRSVSRQSFTPGAAPVSGYEGTFFLRYNQSVAGSGATFNIIEQRVEDVRTLAGQTISVSFWAKAAANTTITSQVQQNFGSGGSPEVQAVSTQTISLTTSWQRFTYTATMPSISGKTIGTNSYVALRFNFPNNATFTADFWGVQLESGSVATSFRKNSSSIEGELAVCQRYFWVGGNGGMGIMNSAVGARFSLQFPVPMRANPTIVTNQQPRALHPTIAESQTSTVAANTTLSIATGGLLNTQSASKIDIVGWSSGADGRAMMLLNDCLNFNAEL